MLGKVFEIHYNLFVSGKYEKIDHKHYDSSPYTWLKPGTFFKFFKFLFGRKVFVCLFVI